MVKWRVFGWFTAYCFFCALFQRRYVSQDVSPSSFHQKSIPSLMKCACVLTYQSLIPAALKS